MYAGAVPSEPPAVGRFTGQNGASMQSALFLDGTYNVGLKCARFSGDAADIVIAERMSMNAIKVGTIHDLSP